MTVKKSADDAAIQHAWESLMVGLRLPVGNDGPRERLWRDASDAKSLEIGGPAAKTSALGRIHFLKTVL